MNCNIEKELQRADDLESLEKYDDSISIYNDLIKIEGNNARLFALRGFAKYKAKYFKDAIDDFSNAIKLKANVPTTLFFRARSKEEIGNLDGALKDYEECAKIDQDKYDIHLNMGLIYEYKGKLKKAKEKYQAVLNLDPTNEIALERLNKIKKHQIKHNSNSR